TVTNNRGQRMRTKIESEILLLPFQDGLAISFLHIRERGRRITHHLGSTHRPEEIHLAAGGRLLSLLRGPDRLVEAGQHPCPMTKAIQSPGLDQALDYALVRARPVHGIAEIIEGVELLYLGFIPCLDDRRDRIEANIFD